MRKPKRELGWQNKAIIHFMMVKKKESYGLPKMEKGKLQKETMEEPKKTASYQGRLKT